MLSASHPELFHYALISQALRGACFKTCSIFIWVAINPSCCKYLIAYSFYMTFINSSSSLPPCGIIAPFKAMVITMLYFLFAAFSLKLTRC